MQAVTKSPTQQYADSHQVYRSNICCRWKTLTCGFYWWSLPLYLRLSLFLALFIVVSYCYFSFPLSSSCSTTFLPTCLSPLSFLFHYFPSVCPSLLPVPPLSLCLSISFSTVGVRRRKVRLVRRHNNQKSYPAKTSPYQSRPDQSRPLKTSPNQ